MDWPDIERRMARKVRELDRSRRRTKRPTKTAKAHARAFHMHALAHSFAMEGGKLHPVLMKEEPSVTWLGRICDDPDLYAIANSLRPKHNATCPDPHDPKAPRPEYPEGRPAPQEPEPTPSVLGPWLAPDKRLGEILTEFADTPWDQPRTVALLHPTPMLMQAVYDDIKKHSPPGQMHRTICMHRIICHVGRAWLGDGIVSSAVCGPWCRQVTSEARQINDAAGHSLCEIDTALGRRSLLRLARDVASWGPTEILGMVPWSQRAGWAWANALFEHTRCDRLVTLLPRQPAAQGRGVGIRLPDADHIALFGSKPKGVDESVEIVVIDR